MTTTHPPGPKGVPLLGNLPGLSRGMLEFMMETATHGGLASFTIGPTRNYLVSDPDLVHDVLVVRRDKFVKDPHDLRTLGRWMGKGLLTSDGDTHRRQRRLVQPAFLHKRMSGYGEIAVDATENLMASWRPGEVHDMHHEMMKLTLNVVSRALFGSGVPDEEALRVQRAVARLQRVAIEISKFGMVVSPTALLPLHGLLKSGTRVLDRAVLRIIAERRASPDTDHGDLLSTFLQAQDETDGTRMSDQEVRDECVTMFVAGQETTANGLTWAWHLLGQHPEVADKLAAELDTVLGDRPATAEDLPNLPYTTMVFKEAMRYCPPAWTLNKRTPVEDTELGGHRLRRGSGIFVMPYVMHHQERFFPDPYTFDPERFHPDKPPPARYTYMPFGGGERLCVGQGFAMMEARLILATMARRWRFDLDPTQKVVINPLVTLAPKNGLRMRLSTRTPQPAG